jgi:serine/threonine protein kinase
MALTIGTQLGLYKIIALLGKGCMGEVYRARDLRLKREVAIKILPEEFSRDGDRVSRFQREAEVLASLNHQNIAATYSAEKLKSGPISIEEALKIGKKRYDLAREIFSKVDKQLEAGFILAWGVVHEKIPII